jgi:predicted secreted protein
MRPPTILRALPAMLVAALAMLLAAPQAQAEPPAPTYDRVSLTASAGREVTNDLLVALLYARQEGTDPTTPAAEVNRRIEWAVQRSRRAEAVQVQTLDYRTTPIYRDQRLSAWRVEQALRLESRDSEALAALLGELQERLGVRSLGYQVSPEAREEAEKALVEEAVAAFRARADRVAGHFGRPGWRLVEARIGTEGAAPPPMPMARAASLQAEMAAPTLEAGTQRVTVTVNGTIELAIE